MPGWHLDKEPLAALASIFHTVVLVLANAGHDLEDTCKKDEASVFAFYRQVSDCVSNQHGGRSSYIHPRVSKREGEDFRF